MFCVLCVCVLGLVGVVLFSFWFLVVACFSFQIIVVDACWLLCFLDMRSCARKPVLLIDVAFG